MRRLAPLVAALSVVACGSTEKTVYAIAGAVLTGAAIPGSEIEQIYYLGVFDPIEQLPETIYRVRVRGQASVLSTARFASGWVPAPLIDSLSSNVRFTSKDGTQVSLSRADDDLQSNIPVGRRMVLFGPEGFREAPADHRLVIVMGSDPDEFFEGMDEAIGALSEAAQDGRSLELTRFLLEANHALRLDQARIQDATDRAAALEIGGEA
ncbi:MAG: hypothetical protein AAFZ87_02680 [Planctomycetota bacterium]